MKQLPPKLEAIRDELYPILNDSHANMIGNHDQINRLKGEGFNAGVQAILESEELRGLVIALKEIDRTDHDCGIDAGVALLALENWHKLIGEDEG